MAVSNAPLPKNHQRVPLIIVATIFSMLGTLIVFVRLHRRFTLKSVGWDDYFMVAAWLSSVSFIVTSALGMIYGVGLFMSQLTLHEIKMVFKITFFIEISYYTTIFLIKMSILFCFLRISTALKDKLYMPTLVFMLIVLLQFFSSIIVIIVQCYPISYSWNKNQEGSCINLEAFIYFMNIFTIATDIFLLLLPVPFLSRVNRSLIQKLALISVFIIGFLSTISSCIRLYTISLFTSSTDVTYNSAPLNLWSFVEINLGLACACGPALKGLFSGFGKSSRPLQSTINHPMLSLQERENCRDNV